MNLKSYIANGCLNLQILAIMSLEFDTLSNCAYRLETAIKSHIKEMAHYLYANGFISYDCQDEVLDPKSRYSEAERATMMVSKIRDSVKLDPSKYYKLLNHLRQDERQNYAIVEILDSEYFGIRKLPPSTRGSRG